MTPKQLAAIERHGRNLLAIFPNASETDPVELCKRLRRYERMGNNYAVRLCNEQVSEADQEASESHILSRVRKILGDSEQRVWLNRDPRGYALKIDLREGERLHTDMGGYGIVAPEIDREGE